MTGEAQASRQRGRPSGPGVVPGRPIWKNKTKPRILLLCFLLCASLLFFCLLGCVSTSAWAQVTSGSLTGIVYDPTGAVVPGAKILLTDMNKGYAYPTTTDGVGRCVITNLLPSTYRITVEASGFQTFIREGITMDVGTRSSVDVTLQLGATTQSVEVTGAAPLLAAQDAVTGQEVDRALINDLPLVGRAVLDLALMAPGVVQAPGAAFSPAGVGNNFSSNGGRNAVTEVLIDGVAATTYEPNTAINTLLYTPSVDAVQAGSHGQCRSDRGLFPRNEEPTVGRAG